MSAALPIASTASSARRTSPFRRAGLAVLGAGVALGGLLGVGSPADAATATFTRTALSATVTGTTVDVSSTVKASALTTAQQFKVCVRDAAKANVDFPAKTGVAVRPGGTPYTGSKTFAAGTYSYFSCLQAGGVWYAVGAPQTFTVAAADATPSTSPTTSPTPAPTTTPEKVSAADNGTAMPTTSTRPGWAYSYGEDFTRSAALGQFSKVYGSNWAGYWGVRNDTSKNGSYQPDKVLSVADGKLDMKLGYDASTGLYNVAAPFPQPPAGVNGGSAEYLGMRTTVRFASSGAMPGYKVAWMLWPSTWDWNHGEIDFPEASLDGPIYGFSHEANTGRPNLNSLWVKSASTMHDGWHTATVEWVPGTSVEFFLDGVSLGKTTQNVPTKPMHWTLQTETELSATAPAKDVSGRISIDWLTVESWKG